MDKAFWQTIVDNEYELTNKSDLLLRTRELVEYLGSPDPLLRETFAYDILARWIVSYRYHSPEELRGLYQVLMRQMKSTLGMKSEDSIFARSYSAAILALIVYRDSREGILDELEVQEILHHAITYLLEEQDTRTYIPEKGWANALTNVSDLFKFLAQHPELAPAELQRLLHAIADKLMQAVETPFSHNEEERLAKVVLTVMLRNDLNAYDFTDWLNRLHEWRLENNLDNQYQEQLNATYQNIKHFLWALWVQMQLVPRLPLSAQEFEPDLKEAVRAFSL